jgi:hypothetical protein
MNEKKEGERKKSTSFIISQMGDLLFDVIA